MAKVLIQEEASEKPVPFLRGILTRSLQDSGLSFGSAFSISTQIRHDLSRAHSDRTLTTEELRKEVAKYLEKLHGSKVAQNYLRTALSPATIYVRVDHEKNPLPFSRSQHQRYLEPCGLSVDQSTSITALVYEQLLNKGDTEVSSDLVRDLTRDYLKQEIGEEAALHYVEWSNFVRSRRPILLLIGGAPGCGKSTIATELAHRLDIVRIQSTDMLREVMRMMIPKRLMPALHTSSFEVWKVLPQTAQNDGSDPDKPLTDGYLAQADLLSVACEGAVQRAIQERVSLILEGVHISPHMLDKLQDTGDTLVIPIMLGVLKPDHLKDRFKGRGEQAPNRRSARYLTHFNEIWRMQSFLLSEADNSDMPIITNDDKELGIKQVMKTIVDRLMAENKRKKSPGKK